MTMPRTIINPTYPIQDSILFSKIPEFDDIYPATSLIKDLNGTPLLPANTVNNPNAPYTTEYKFIQSIKNINKPFTKSLIGYILKTINRKCNHGIGIHIKLLLLLQPAIHKLTYIKPVAKPKRNHHHIDNYREISLNGAFKKIYELALLYKGLEFVISNGNVHPNNTTNMKGKSTRDIATVLLNDVYNQWTQKLPTYAIFSDIKQDFPSVNYAILIQRLHHYYHFPFKYIKAIYDLFINSWCCVIVNGIRSKWYLQLIGLAQGRPLSPFLNMLYLDPLHHIIPKHLPLKKMQ
eukprot:248008_1